MKRGVTFFGILLILLSLLSFSVLADGHDTTEVGDLELGDDATEDLWDDIDDAELQHDAGLTPDSPFYFLDELFENVGDNPAKALAAKEEKIQEALAMLEKGDVDAAEELLEKAASYSEVLEKEVSPDLDRDARVSSKAVTELLAALSEELSDEEREALGSLIDEHLAQEEEIAVAAKISSQIEELCTALAELDPHEYAKVCKTDADAPEWLQELDAELTAEQQEEAEDFFIIMSECFRDPANCRCNDVSVASFAEMCSDIAPLAAACEEGDESACDEMDEVDMEELLSVLPEHLQMVFLELEDRNEYDRLDPECTAAGLETWEECDIYRFENDAPSECVEAYESGEIIYDDKPNRELWEQCDEIMFTLHAPEVCVEAGVTDHEECGRLDFEANAPQECLDAGIDGGNHYAWEDCEQIMQSVSHGDGFIMDCGSIEDPTERLACYDGALGYVDDVLRDEYGNSIGVPGACEDAGISDHEECDEYMKENGYYDEPHYDEYEVSEGVPGVCEDAGISDHGECDEYMKEEGYYYEPDHSEDVYPEGYDGGEDNYHPDEDYPDYHDDFEDDSFDYDGEYDHGSEVDQDYYHEEQDDYYDDYDDRDYDSGVEEHDDFEEEKDEPEVEEREEQRDEEPEQEESHDDSGDDDSGGDDEGASESDLSGNFLTGGISGSDAFFGYYYR